MSNKVIRITSEIFPDVCLRSINEGDLENLRLWKNKNTSSFFYQEEITEIQQKKWFEGFLGRDNDYMFMFEEYIGSGCESLGCLGFRLIDNVVDIYNVIRGNKTGESKGKIKDALKMMCCYIKMNYDYKITCKVIRSNPAVEWYKKNGFEIISDNGTYYDLQLKDGFFEECDIQYEIT
ncbi:MAG: hypothetical protein ACOYWZ_03515 [Bacillota bacterium]